MALISKTIFGRAARSSAANINREVKRGSKSFFEGFNPTVPENKTRNEVLTPAVRILFEEHAIVCAALGMRNKDEDEEISLEQEIEMFKESYHLLVKHERMVDILAARVRILNFNLGLLGRDDLIFAPEN